MQETMMSRIGPLTVFGFPILLLLVMLCDSTYAQSPDVIYGKSYSFVESGSQCASGGCVSYSEPGKIQILRGGSVLYYFGNHRGGYYPQGIKVELNRTVSLSGGRVPRGFTFGQLADVRRDAVPANVRGLGGLPFRSGSASTTFDGRQVHTSLDFEFVGNVPGTGNGSAQVHVDYLLDIDGRTGAFLGGRGSTRGSGTTSTGTVSFSGNSTVAPR